MQGGGLDEFYFFLLLFKHNFIPINHSLFFFFVVGTFRINGQPAK